MPKVTMIGAGSVVFTKNLMTDILSLSDIENLTISLMDINADRLHTAKLMVEQVADALNQSVTIEAHVNRKDALRNADYVINAIQVGMHKATLIDFEIPKKYGLPQTIADTLGIGGIFRGLRTVPVLLDICKDMEEVCPDALLLNYTNPMAILCLAVAKRTSIRHVGLCHSVQHTSKELAKLLEVPYEELEYKVAGINHVAFFLDLKHKKEDLYPKLFEAVNRTGFYEEPGFRSTHLGKVRFEAFKRFGYFVTESSEHFAEYVPYFIKHPQLIEELEIPIDEYIRRSENNLKEFEEVKSALQANKPIEICPSHEYAAKIIHSIETGTDWSFNGNVYNNGLISNLPSDSCVEVPCLVNRSGIQPTKIGELPLQLAALIRTNINVQQLTVEAVLTGNRDYVYQAAMMDPNTASILSIDQIWKMTDELIEAHGDALPEFKSQRLRLPQAISSAI